MTEQAKQWLSSSREDGSIELSPIAAEELRSVFEQMDLLLKTREVDSALPHLLTMLRCLRMLRKEVGR